MPLLLIASIILLAINLLILYRGWRWARDARRAKEEGEVFLARAARAHHLAMRHAPIMPPPLPVEDQQLP